MLKILMKCCITRVVVGDHRQLVLVTEIRGALPVAGMVLTGLLVEGGLQVVAVIHLEGPGFLKSGALEELLQFSHANSTLGFWAM